MGHGRQAPQAMVLLFHRTLSRHGSACAAGEAQNAKWTQAFKFTDEGQDDEGEAEGEETPPCRRVVMTTRRPTSWAGTPSKTMRGE